MKYLVLMASLVLPIPSALPAQIIRIDGSAIDAKKLSERIQALAATARVTGLAVTILNANEIAYQRAFGLANRDTGDSLRMDAVFYGASFSKAVFGYIVAHLVTEGTLDLDTPLQDYLDTPLPEIKFAKAWRGYANLAGDERYRQLTARMCLAHTTGFPNWRWIDKDGNFFSEGDIHFRFDPGTQYSYSGEGIKLLQFVIEQHTGRQLEDLAKAYVFDPFGMTMISYLWQERFEGVFCNGHTADEAVLPKDRGDEANAAGSLETTPEDYARFVRGVLRERQAGSAAMELLWTPNIRIRSRQQFGPEAWETTAENDAIALSYGLGWGLLTSPYGPAAFKEGHGEGFQHYSIVFPEQQTAVILMANSDNAESIFRDLLALTIGDRYTPWRWEGYWPFGE